MTRGKFKFKSTAPLVFLLNVISLRKNHTTVKLKLRETLLLGIGWDFDRNIYMCVFCDFACLNGQILNIDLKL